jgi:hypothetical protein
MLHRGGPGHSPDWMDAIHPLFIHAPVAGAWNRCIDSVTKQTGSWDFHGL